MMTMRIRAQILQGRLLGELKRTNDAETDLICSAIYHHDDKLVTDVQWTRF